MDRQGAQAESSSTLGGCAACGARKPPAASTYAPNAEGLCYGPSRQPNHGQLPAAASGAPPQIFNPLLSVQWYLVSVNQTVCFVGHTDHCKEFTKRFVRHSGLLCSFGM
jgi:hypothetical protein